MRVVHLPSISRAVLATGQDSSQGSSGLAFKSLRDLRVFAIMLSKK